MKAFDTPNITFGHEDEILKLEYLAVGKYLRSDRTTVAEIKALHAKGIKIFSIWEKGFPTSAAYFNAAQGTKDALAAVAFAKKIGQPAGTQIFTCVDYDANWSSDGNAIQHYFEAFQKTVKAAGFLASVYGSGVVCQHLVNAGFAHSGFLAQSTGWAGHAAYAPHAAIIQGGTTTVLHFDVDLDNIVDETVCW